MQIMMKKLLLGKGFPLWTHYTIGEVSVGISFEL